MKIISHRGYWKQPQEKNTPKAFERSFALGFGTETDIRDAHGQLVISHDMPHGNEISFSRMLDMAADHSSSATPITLALNIKADGLAGMVATEIAARPSLDCFVFDMAVPDMRSYISAGVPVFTRMSEVESSPAWLELAHGVWLDAFTAPWYSHEEIEKLLSKLRVCVVSNELHKRDHLSHWEWLKPLARHSNLLLCTDFPEDAEIFFNTHGMEYEA